MINPASTTSPPIEPETRLKRLYFRSVHRGSKEMDIILGKFARAKLDALSGGIIDMYEQLLDEDDAVLWDWFVGKSAAPAQYHALIALIHTCQSPDSVSQ